MSTAADFLQLRIQDSDVFRDKKLQQLAITMGESLPNAYLNGSPYNGR